MTLVTLGTLSILTRFVGCDQRAGEAAAALEVATLSAQEVTCINLLSRIVAITLENPNIRTTLLTLKT